MGGLWHCFTRIVDPQANDVEPLEQRNEALEREPSTRVSGKKSRGGRGGSWKLVKCGFNQEKWTEIGI